MRKLKLKLVVLLFIIPLAFPTMSFGQKVNCQGKWDIQPEPPYYESSFTKIANCRTGKKYEFIIPLSTGKEYSISFYASSSFNNSMNFVMEDLNSGAEVLNLPGENVEANNDKGTCVLAPYYDEKKQKSVHPCFQISPENATNLKIVIDIPNLPGEDDVTVNKKTKTGCVKVLIFEKEVQY